MPNKLIDIVGVSKSYGDNLVLDDLNLYIRENEFLTRRLQLSDLPVPERQRFCVSSADSKIRTPEK